MENIIDLYTEHSQHDRVTGYLFKHCSECYKEYKETLKDRGGFVSHERELELTSELSTHPEQAYW